MSRGLIALRAVHAALERSAGRENLNRQGAEERQKSERKRLLRLCTGGGVKVSGAVFFLVFKAGVWGEASVRSAAPLLCGSSRVVMPRGRWDLDLVADAMRSTLVARFLALDIENLHRAT